MREHGVPGSPEVPGDFGNTNFWVTVGTRSYVWIREPVVPGDSVQGDWGGDFGNPEFRVIPWTWGFEWLRVPREVATRIPGFLVTPGSRSGWVQDAGYPGDSGNRSHTEHHSEPREPGVRSSQSYLQIRDPGVTRKSWFPESPRAPGSRSHRVTRNFGFAESPTGPGSRSDPRGVTRKRVTRNYRFPEPPEICVPGVTRNSLFTMSPGTPGSGTLRSRVIPKTRSAGWLRQPGDPG